ncbi:glycine cleavage system protein H, partial [Candidatus Sumerlaeota bacterium]|nr:glycine cleavage system protein H [Candidatus Sumerlaeota bacterium]
STLINKDPYGEGWIVKISPTNLDEELAKLMTVNTLTPWLEKEIKRAEAEEK